MFMLSADILLLSAKIAWSCFQLAEQTFKEAVGDGIWLAFVHGRAESSMADSSSHIQQYKDMQLFHRLEEDGAFLELPWYKVTALYNLARLLEQLHNTETACMLYRLILFKVCIFVIVSLISEVICDCYSHMLDDM